MPAAMPSEAFPWDFPWDPFKAPPPIHSRRPRLPTPLSEQKASTLCQKRERYAALHDAAPESAEGSARVPGPAATLRTGQPCFVR